MIAAAGAVLLLAGLLVLSFAISGGLAFVCLHLAVRLTARN